MTDEQKSEFDWLPLGEGFWTEAAATCGATALQARFACCRHRGMTATGAAKLAGYTADGDGIRQAGSRAAKSTAVMNLLAMAVAEAGGGDDGVVDSAEAKRILSRLARGSDPNVRIKALESLNKLEQNERSTVTEQPSLEEQARALVRMVRPERVPLVWGELILRAMCWYAPYVKEMVPFLAAHHAEDWQVLRGALAGKYNQMNDHVDKLERGPLLSLDEILARVGMSDPSTQLKTAEATVVEEEPIAAA
jgi:hypothetical protein